MGVRSKSGSGAQRRARMALHLVVLRALSTVYRARPGGFEPPIHGFEGILGSPPAFIRVGTQRRTPKAWRSQFPVRYTARRVE